jgi:ferrous iron transport protein B
MMDVATGQGLKIDVDKLSQQLGVPIVPIQANQSKGLDGLKSMIAKVLQESHCAAGPAFPDAFENELSRLQSTVHLDEPPYLLRRLLLDVGGHAEKRLTEKYGSPLAVELKAARARLVEAGFTLAGIEARIRYAWIRKALTGCIQRPVQRPVSWTDRMDRVLTHKVWGTLIFLLVMFLVFETIFVAAKPFMDWISVGVDWLGELVRGAMSAGPLRSLIVEGIIKGVGAVIVFIPQIMFLFAIIAFLEDCGYMARAAFLMDRLMARAGLNGKSFIPLLSSMACAVPGIMAARVIESPRDRLATILVAPLMSCSARFPVYTLLISAFLPVDQYGWWVPGLAYFGLYMLGLILAPAIALLLKSTLLRGETPVFVMEMPLYKLPSLYTVLRRAFDAGWMFLKRAGTMILASMVIVWALLYFPSGDYPARIEAMEDVLDQPREQLKAMKAELSALENAEPKNEAAIEAKKKAIDDQQEAIEPVEKKLNETKGEWKAQSYLGIVGHWIEPAVRPLGWDWRIGMAAIASFPAREVMVGTLGIIFGEGEGDAKDGEYTGSVGRALRDSQAFDIPVALSVLVFFALCSQCVSTLVVIKRETNSWRWPIFTFVYMTVLAYLGAMLTYQIGSLF